MRKCQVGTVTPATVLIPSANDTLETVKFNAAASVKTTIESEKLRTQTRITEALVMQIAMIFPLLPMNWNDATTLRRKL